MVVVQGGPSSIARQDDKMSVEARRGSTWKRPGGNTWWVQRPEQDWAGLDDSDVDSGLRLWNIWGRRESGLAWTRPHWRQHRQSLGESLRGSCRSGLLSLSEPKSDHRRQGSRQTRGRLSSDQSTQEAKSEETDGKVQTSQRLCDRASFKSTNRPKAPQHPRTTIEVSLFSFVPPAMR